MMNILSWDHTALLCVLFSVHRLWRSVLVLITCLQVFSSGALEWFICRSFRALFTRLYSDYVFHSTILYIVQDKLTHVIDTESLKKLEQILKPLELQDCLNAFVKR